MAIGWTIEIGYISGATTHHNRDEAWDKLKANAMHLISDPTAFRIAAQTSVDIVCRRGVWNREDSMIHSAANEGRELRLNGERYRVINYHPLAHVGFGRPYPNYDLFNLDDFSKLFGIPCDAVDPDNLYNDVEWMEG